MSRDGDLDYELLTDGPEGRENAPRSRLLPALLLIAGVALVLAGVGVAVGLTVGSADDSVVELKAATGLERSARAGKRARYLLALRKGEFRSKQFIRAAQSAGARSKGIAFKLPGRGRPLRIRTLRWSAEGTVFSWEGQPTRAGASSSVVVADGQVEGEIVHPPYSWRLHGPVGDVEVDLIDQRRLPNEGPGPAVPRAARLKEAAAPQFATRASLPSLTLLAVFNKKSCTAAERGKAVAYRNKLRSSWGDLMGFTKFSVRWTCVKFTSSKDSGTQLKALASSKAVQKRRTQLGADLVFSVLHMDDVCGRGYLGPTDKYAYSVTDPDCIGGHTLEHELGHNLGLNHNRYAISTCCKKPKKCKKKKNYGFINSHGRTIMAYRSTSNCRSEATSKVGNPARIPVYSGFKYNGRTFGSKKKSYGSWARSTFAKSWKSMAKNRKGTKATCTDSGCKKQ